MLFTNISEIRNILPTARWNDLNKLASLLEEEEQNNLMHILGTTLYRQIQEDYEGMNGDSGMTESRNDGETEPQNNGETVEHGEEEEETKKFKLAVIRTCQRVTFYMVLAHNSGLFSLSFNEGGGVNSSTAENYDEANEKAVQRFVKDAFNKANRNIDSLLRLLEMDAQGKQVYTNAWKESRYFYRQAGLLFTTAVELQEFLNIDESRERFIQLVPRIRYTQSTYIRPRLGTKLLNDLIGLKYGANGANGDDNENLNGGTIENEGESLLPALLIPVLTSLALYVESTEKSMARPLSFNEGEMQIAQARQFIKQHPEEFAEYYCPELADILPPPAPEGSRVQGGQGVQDNLNGETVEHKPHHKDEHQPHHDPYVLDLGGLTHS